MPILDWIGKKQVINHDKEVPFRLLKRVHSLSVGESENLIIKGDNLEALKALLPYYYNKVKCIYIDPPYNTGNENWIYNDRVNSPEMKKWLGRVVGSEGEDLSSHDKWLCMMYPRLKLLRELLSNNGFICVSIGDEEVHNLRSLMDEVFGKGNYRNTISVRRFDKNLSRQFLEKGLPTLTIGFEYVLIYSKTTNSFLNPVFREASEERQNFGYWKGFWNAADRPTMRDELLGVKPETGQWKWKKKVALEAVENYKEYQRNFENKITLEEYWEKTGEVKKFIRRRTDLKSGKNKGVEHWIPPSEGVLVSSNWSDLIASQTLKEFDLTFNNPKNIHAIKRILELTTDEDSIILDSFSGSGTTAHAVLELNKEDGGNRKFILVEMEDEIARKVTAERVKRVIKGYTYKNSKGDDVRVEGLAPDRDIQGGFQFMNLDTELFDAHGLINDNIDYIDLARYIFFSETKLDLKEKAMKDHFIGERNGTEYYLIYKQGKENILNEKTASKLKKTDKEKIVYADNCTLDSDTLAELRIVFKQIPYEVRGF